MSSATGPSLEVKMDSLIDLLFEDQIWEHRDEFTDTLHNRHVFFDADWDQSHLEELRARLITKTQEVQRLKRRADQLQQPVATSKRPRLAPIFNTRPSSSREGVASTPAPASAAREAPTIPSTAPEGVARASESQQAAPFSSQSPILEAPVTGCPNTTDQASRFPERSGNAVPVTQDDDQPNPDVDYQSFVADVGNPTSSLRSNRSSRRAQRSNHESLLTNLQSLLTAMNGSPPDPFEDDCPADINLNALSSIMDLRNIRHDGVTIDGIFEIENPLAFAAGSNNNPDILSQSQMLKAADRDEFLKVQGSELLGLHDADVFEYLPRSKLPSGSRVLNAIWSYRRKRKPDGTLSKYKSRICADGSQQKYGIDYWETYSPVVNWSTVRLVFVLATMLGLKVVKLTTFKHSRKPLWMTRSSSRSHKVGNLTRLQESLSASKKIQRTVTPRT